MVACSGMLAEYLKMKCGLKIGGDKGGKTFKMVFQIVNTRAPNSPNNTVIFSIFEAPDSVTNLKVVGDRFGEEIRELHLEVRLGDAFNQGKFYSFHNLQWKEDESVYLWLLRVPDKNLRSIRG